MSNSSKTKASFITFDDWRAVQGFDEEDEEETAIAAKKLLRTTALFQLRVLRLEKGLTQQQLADQLGITQNRVSKLERLDLDRAELRTIRAYLKALGGELSLLVDLEGVQHKIELNNKSEK
jgi:predicted XRE-type DNA-binding protein